MGCEESGELVFLIISGILSLNSSLHILQVYPLLLGCIMYHSTSLALYDSDSYMDLFFYKDAGLRYTALSFISIERQELVQLQITFENKNKKCHG